MSATVLSGPMTWKSYAVVSGAGLLATYLASPTLAPKGADAPAPPAAQAVSAGSPDIEYEAARLQKRVRDETAFRTPSRDPFRFAPAARAARPAPALPASVATPEPGAAPAPEQPFIALSGVAADVVDGVLKRTAILTTFDGVVLAGAGEMVGPYRVRAVHEESVELESTVDGSIRHLRFASAAPPAAGPAVP